MSRPTRKKVREFRAIFRRFERIHRTLMEDRDCCSGLTITQCHPLLEIEEMGQSNLKDLASKMNLDKSTLSRTIDGLVRRGLVKREADSDDRRYVFLTLTAEGQKICDDINERNDRFYEGILRKISKSTSSGGIEYFDELVRILCDAVSPAANCSCEKSK
jgi:DNA-binding MarR family transcriptional regulator